MTRRSKTIFLTSSTIALLVILTIFGISTLRTQLKLMDNLKTLSSNPGNLDPLAMVKKIDSNFDSLPDDEKKRIAADPKLLSERIRAASYQNYQKAFGELFMLPEPVRRKIIQHSAESIASAIDKNRAKVDEFYDSDAGKAALAAASEYFFMELNGKSKNELKPITDAFFKIHTDRVQRGKN